MPIAAPQPIAAGTAGDDGLDRDLALAALAPDAAALSIALAIGLLVGTERGWQSRADTDGSRVAGFRTFGLLGLGGGLAALLAGHGAAAVAALLVAGLVAALVIGYRADAVRDGKISATDGIAAVLTIGCGYLAGSSQATLGAGVAAAMVLLLALRTELHRIVAGLDDSEVKGIARLAVLSLVALPLLPDRQLGPLAAWNPRSIWLVVVIVSALSLIGYFAVRRLGTARGTLATAAAGATVSSTAVTVALARQMRKSAQPSPLLAAGVAAASTVMLGRTLLMTAILAPFALPTLAAVVGPAALVALLSMPLLLRRGTGDATALSLPLGNPFDLRPALILAALVAAISVASRWAALRWGDAGLATVLAITGAMDVDSAIITMHGLAPGSVSGRVAGLILAAPIMLNTLFKAVLAVAIGGWRQSRGAALSLLASVAAGAAALALLWLA